MYTTTFFQKTKIVIPNLQAAIRGLGHYNLHLGSAISAFRTLFVACCCFLAALHTHAQTSASQPATIKTNNASSALLPLPQQLDLTEKLFPIGKNWKIIADPALAKEQTVKSLQEGLKEAGLPLSLAAGSAAGHSPAIRLVVQKGSVKIGASVDTNQIALARQAYRLSLKPGSITITANASQGLYYGVQTFLQLLRSQAPKMQLPEGEITDWPNVEVRMIYWDDAHHVEKLSALKRIIRQASTYKINAFSIKLEGHFNYKSAPAIVEPHALSPAEYQEMADFAKAHYVDLVPFLDAPAHVSFILKHPEYRKLRLIDDINYQFSVTNPETFKLLDAMFSELINASKGSKFIILSNDEAYYTGKAPSEKAMADSLGGNGKLLAWFIKKMADRLHEQGRTVLFWGEFPLRKEDITALPSHLVNGVYNNVIAADYKKHGIRQFVYTATQGAEPVFPNYYPLHTKTGVMADGSDRSSGRVGDMMKEINTAFTENLSSFMGVVIAGWADAGLHPETFWLGYATATAAGWNSKNLTPADASARFMEAFYGPSQKDMDSVYHVLSEQAEFHTESWDWIPSPWRPMIKGNSDSLFLQPERDQTLPLLPVPEPGTLVIANKSYPVNAERFSTAQAMLPRNAYAQQLLRENKSRAGSQLYNLEVLESVAAICGQNLRMLVALNKVTDLLQKASAAGNPAQAVKQLDAAMEMVGKLKTQRDSTLELVTKIWYKEWQPLVEEANGRKFLHQVDDIKDHQPVRTIDLSYLIYRELHYPLDQWWNDVKKVRNDYADKHQLPLMNKQLNWQQYK
ncbi:glycoside hydrolase family 20 zincin-like fold domain-containing protein [Dyadobacter fanqingshengii]|uniref:beta-N-acetylhexosaminidase n=1 Tax=Dyadobacter fanqingshengii TaxID=2906443 RepID=A0A9X1TAW9_9BACT|nr:glycoside hydrolase family 20 zincin-like fold domain-containing protein [Dyadobacter fanqingshengii]MCF0041404.1 beta-N-acetylhexosaminidase [Dyadobacter fanqingshengii]USJ36875.1 beta-N-acetylhexosaminidase [Dyadobacter fanqingshengii]